MDTKTKANDINKIPAGETENSSILSSDLSVCGICGSKRIERRKNIGWDVWEGGEETRHEERCLNCGATRIVCEWVEHRTGISYSEWSQNAEYIPHDDASD